MLLRQYQRRSSTIDPFICPLPLCPADSEETIEVWSRYRPLGAPGRSLTSLAHLEHSILLLI